MDFIKNVEYVTQAIFVKKTCVVIIKKIAILHISPFIRLFVGFGVNPSILLIFVQLSTRLKTDINTGKR